MNFLEIMIVEKLKDIDSNLDLTGADHKILQVACEDLTNYLKFHWNLVGNTANQCEIVERLEQLFKEDYSELDDFLTVWTGMWFKKWKERVKVLIGEQNTYRWNNPSRTHTNIEELWVNLEYKQELLEIVAATLIKNGEICGTEILAENLLKMELAEKRTQILNGKERTLSLINNTLRKARDMAQSKGPLIFVKIDKGYYNTANT